MNRGKSRMTALITGAAGFIGSHLTRYMLANSDVDIVALDDLSGGFRENLPTGATFVQGSVTDARLMSALFEEYQFDYVYHLAAYAAEGLSHFIRRFNYTNNLIGSVNLINESVKHKTKCFVFTSSIAVYGAAQTPMREDTIPLPEDPYGISKYAVELDLKAAHDMFGLNYVIFRPHNVYGEFQNIGDKYRNVVGIFMNQILQGKPITIFGDGEQRRAFSYVGDIVGPLAMAPWTKSAQNRVFNIGADIHYSVNELACAVKSAMDAPNHPVEYLDPRNEVVVAHSDHTALFEVFGVTSNTTLGTGLTKMAAWVTSVGARRSQTFDGIEIAEGLPRVWQA